jgi:hypothetical protein
MNRRLASTLADLCDELAVRAHIAALVLRPVPLAQPAFEPPVDVDPVRSAREHLRRCQEAADASAAGAGYPIDRLVDAFLLDLAKDSYQDVLDLERSPTIHGKGEVRGSRADIEDELTRQARRDETRRDETRRDETRRDGR